MKHTTSYRTVFSHGPSLENKVCPAPPYAGPYDRDGSEFYHSVIG